MSARTFALLALFLWFAGAIYVATMFIGGRTGDSPDGRTLITLDASETDFVLAEMRGMLEATRDLAHALADGDRAALVAAARTVGAAEAEGAPKSLMLKLPLDFKRFGLETHDAFDALAAAAEAGDDQAALTGRLADILDRCTGCHAAYRFR